MAYYWTTEDLDAGRCTLRDLGEMRPAVTVMDAVRLDNSPESMDRVGVETLMRLAQQQRDLPTALKAALALLDRTRGRVMPLQAPPGPPSTPGDDPLALPKPDWYDANSRLRYQAEGEPVSDQT